MLLYITVAFKDPGYVTSYVLRTDDLEEDIEKAKGSQHHHSSTA